jgi:hypothetical protein
MIDAPSFDQASAMWSPFVHRRRPPPPGPALVDDDEEPPQDAPAACGWHQSSWALAAGVEVIELPAAAAASWFAEAA